MRVEEVNTAHFDYIGVLIGAFMSIYTVIAIILHNLHTIFDVLNNSYIFKDCMCCSEKLFETKGQE